MLAYIPYDWILNDPSWDMNSHSSTSLLPNDPDLTRSHQISPGVSICDIGGTPWRHLSLRLPRSWYHGDFTNRFVIFSAELISPAKTWEKRNKTQQFHECWCINSTNPLKRWNFVQSMWTMVGNLLLYLFGSGFDNLHWSAWFFAPDSRRKNDHARGSKHFAGNFCQVKIMTSPNLLNQYKVVPQIVSVQLVYKYYN